MQLPKLQVLSEAGAVRLVTVSYETEASGWVVQVEYMTRGGLRCETLERQRGGARVFATLDAAARCLAGLGLDFQVQVAGLNVRAPS